MECPRSWSPEKCNRCWPNFSDSSNLKCPSGWCSSSSSSCQRSSECPRSHCPSQLSGLCENWGDCCMFDGSSGSNQCETRSECPRSWSSRECNECWISSASSGSPCPGGWCPLNWSGRCHSWSRCPRSHCPSYKFSNANVCENWGDCCLTQSISSSSFCRYEPDNFKFE
jgi:hypothetical protein